MSKSYILQMKKLRLCDVTWPAQSHHGVGVNRMLRPFSERYIIKDITMAGLPSGSGIKNLPANAGAVGDLGSIPGWGRAPGGGNDNPLQYCCLGNPMDRGVWWATVHGVARVRHNWARIYNCGLLLERLGKAWKWSCSVVSDSLRPHGL